MKNISRKFLICFLFLTVPALGQDATDEVIVKSVDAVMFTMARNLQLTQDQTDQIRPVVTDAEVKERQLQQALEQGDIDGPTMYHQRQQVINDENKALAAVLSADQMKIWINIQNEEPPPSHSRH